MKFTISLSLAMLIAVPLASAEANAKAKADTPDAMRHMVVAPEIDFANLRDPFESYLEVVAAQRKAAQEKQAAQRSSRPLEVLEAFDLDTLKLVAIFTMGDKRVAMVEDAQGKGHLVSQGNYMGKNNGRIEKLSDDTIYLVEQIADPAGDLVDRQVTMTMKEVNE